MSGPYLPSWDNAWRVAETKQFIGMSRLNYYDVEVRVLEMTENAILCKDAGGVERQILREDASFASWYIARDNLGSFVTLKVRQWKS